MTNQNHESGIATAIELGCSCRDDLAFVHRDCAENWFRTKGNKICEICGSIARNVPDVVEVQTTEQLNANDDLNAPMQPPNPPSCLSVSDWLVFFILACIVIALVIACLFLFKVLK
ncbi:queuine tRNA-ribosyltransferase subunit QTRTD1 [Spatholobus suberectus]|nr:queuine tRNA-ribosyltransferase subunit QTRTD1 [Spatholobus suberectus]